MKLRIKSKSAGYVLIAFTVATLLPLTGFAKPQPIMTTDLLQHLRKGEPWDKSVFIATKMVMFQQAASGGSDATSISKITLSYFTSPNCTATNGTSVPTYTTLDGTPFTIDTITPFGMVAASAWNVGSSKVTPAVADMAQIQSIAVTFKSTNNNTPQASFTGVSFACVQVSCSSGECISGSGTQSFQLKTTAAVGDPADGGIIGCQNTGVSPNLFNLVVPASDNNGAATIVWSAVSSTTGATSMTDGATNTTTIVDELSPAQAVGSYAAGVCSIYTAAGGFTSGWFLPAGGDNFGNQLNCLYTNRAAIATGAAVSGGSGFTTDFYWSSTEANANSAWRQNFSNGLPIPHNKGGTMRIRCSRAFT